MGGKAIKSTYTRRYNVQEYFDLWAEISYIIHNQMDWVGYLLPAYRNKNSFGDMDILIFHDGRVKNPKKQIQTYFSPNEIFHNGSVYSFDYKELQIDFIITPERNWETSINFFSYNDLGNFIGKIAHKLKVKYSFEGLKFVHRTKEGRIMGEIILSKDPSVILPFLGFDYERWKQGFDNKEDIFEYIINSKYFNLDIFKFKNLSRNHKKRNKRRKMYFDFIDYCYNKTNLPKYKFCSDKKVYFDYIEQWFPGFKNRLKEFENKEKQKKKIAEKFNGHLIMKKIPGLNGKKLGMAISQYKKSKNNFENFILNNNKECIMDDFEFFYYNYFFHENY